jgi:antitoxin component YwqK of YwqJK toxin-antitoxin module
MKTFFICVVFMAALAQALSAQDTLTFYYDKNWNEIQDKALAEFYRKAVAGSNGVYFVSDHYKNGQIQMTGSYSSKKFKEKTGHFIYYFENGHKDTECNFLKDNTEGLWTSYYENDVKKAEGKYSAGKKVDTWSYYNEDGKLKAKELYERNQLKIFELYYCNGSVSYHAEIANGSMQAKATLYTIDGKPVLTGNLKNGERDGEWIRTFENGEMKLYYKDGYLLNKPLGGIVRKE